MKHYERKKKNLIVRSQQLLVQLANLLQLILQFLIVFYPALYLLPLIGMQADLLVLSSRVADRKHRHRMPFATRALGASLAVADGAIQQRTTHNLGN